jgi:hypothetical protein
MLGEDHRYRLKTTRLKGLDTRFDYVGKNHPPMCEETGGHHLEIRRI